MKLALMGGEGQLAHDLIAPLQALGDVCVLSHEMLDICDPNHIASWMSENLPDVVVNSAAYNQVDAAETQPEKAFAVNALGPLHLARGCQTHGATLVQFSTDYVFGSDRRPPRPWNEGDTPNPVSVYGSSKLAGETLVRAYCTKHLILRTCGLYGIKGSRGKGGNFVEKMLSLGRAGRQVRVVHDQVCTPSFTKDVAAATAHLLAAGQTGTWHVVNSGACSWFEFACEIFHQAKLPVDCAPINSAEFAAPAARPPYSVLSMEKLLAAGAPMMPQWQDALGRYLAERSVAN